MRNIINLFVKIKSFETVTLANPFEKAEACVFAVLSSYNVILNPFDYMESEAGMTIKDIVEALGYDLEFEGSSYTLGKGVYCIE